MSDEEKKLARFGFILDEETTHKILIVGQYMGKIPYEVVKGAIDTLYKAWENRTKDD